MLDKYEMLTEKMKDIPKLSEEIIKVYKEEYDDSFEKILIDSEITFMKNLSSHVESIIEEKYSPKAFELIQFVSLIKSIEKEFHESVYLIEKSICKEYLKQWKEVNSNSFDSFPFRKHCNYQENIPLHECDQKNHFKIIYQPNQDKEIFGVICTNCNSVYKKNFIKLYCPFSYTSYYSCIEMNQNDKNIQPATWEKYHCNLIMNEQMKCLQCKNVLSYNLSTNRLICLSCGFNSEPDEILWKCVKCGEEFHSGAKIYNPYEYKPISLAIKKALYDKIPAEPSRLKCGHTTKGIKHKLQCNGDLLIAYLNNRKMILCTKCKALNKYDTFIWTCSICGERSRDNGSQMISPYSSIKKLVEHKRIVKKKYSELSLINKTINLTIDKEEKSFDIQTSIKPRVSLMKSNQLQKSSSKLYSPIMSVRSGEEFFKKKAYSSIQSSEQIDYESQTNYSSVIANRNTESITLSKRKEHLPQIPIFTYDDYEVVSQLSQGKRSKVLCVQNRQSISFYAMKREPFSCFPEQNNKISKLAIQYDLSFSNDNITKLLYLNISSEEISIIEELGIQNWKSEISTMRKLKKTYSEIELVHIIYQLSSALKSLHNSSNAHCNVCLTNILVFKDKIYKLCDFDTISDNISNLTKADLNDIQLRSPSINQYIMNVNNEVEKNIDVDLYKNDVYSLGLCIICTMLPSDDITGVKIDFMEINQKESQDYIRKAILKYMSYVNKLNHSERFYTNRLIHLLSEMLNVNEKNRMSFSSIMEYISKEYNILC